MKESQNHPLPPLRRSSSITCSSLITVSGNDDGATDDITDEVIVAEVTEDGNIVVEDMVISPDLFAVLFPPVDHPQ